MPIMNIDDDELAGHAGALGGPHLRAWPTARAGRLRPHKGGGAGDGGAAQLEADRQERVRSSVDKINAIFNGQSQVVPTTQATAYDPSKTYYNADGTQYVAPTTTSQVEVKPTGTTTQWGGDNAGSSFELDPGIERRAGAGGDDGGDDSYYRTVSGIDGKAINDALQGGQLYDGVQTVGGVDRNALYDEQRQAVTDINTRDVNRQAQESERANRFGLARNGLSGGSVDVDSNAEITRRQNEGLIKSAGLGDQAAADLKTADEKTRQNLISMAQSGIDTGQAGQLALSGLDANASNAASASSGATVGSLFGDLSNAYLLNQRIAGTTAGATPYQTTSSANNIRTGYAGTGG